MNKFLIAVMLLGIFTVTEASARNNRHGYYQPRHHYVPQHRHKPNYGAIIGGAIAAGIIGAIIYDQYGRRCVNEIVGYDSFGDPVVKQICR